jgi:hypothetical protein
LQIAGNGYMERVMKRLRRLGVILLLAGLPFTSVSGDPSAIGQLEMREYLIVVYTSYEGPVYTVKTRDDVVVEEKITELMLATLFPDLYETVRYGIARFSK